MAGVGVSTMALKIASSSVPISRAISLARRAATWIWRLSVKVSTLHVHCSRTSRVSRGGTVRAAGSGLQKLWRRLAAAATLPVFAAMVAVVVIMVLRHLVVELIGAAAAALIGLFFLWYGFTARGPRRAVRLTISAVMLMAAVAILIYDGAILSLLVLQALTAVAATLVRLALGTRRRVAVARSLGWRPVSPAAHPVLFVNPRSGGGKAIEAGLEHAATSRGIETVVLHQGDDLDELARDAVSRGADVLGMAGGDGSLGIVAAVAADHDLPFVVVPAGTRNHFALDLGVDRRDLIGSLDAFGGLERRIDLCRVGSRVFLNNVSIGAYARVVQSPDYRDDKVGTAARTLPNLIGPQAALKDLKLTQPDGTPCEDSEIILISNNPYVFDPRREIGTRPKLDGGDLGVVSVAIAEPRLLRQLMALEGAARARQSQQARQFPGWREWSTPSLTIEGTRPVEAGIDGEAAVLTPPIVFIMQSLGLRVRISPNHPGASPGALPPWLSVWTLRELVAVTLGLDKAPD